MEQEARAPSGEEWTLDYVQQRLSTIKPRPERAATGGEPADGYEEAAAVLAHFDPIDLAIIPGKIAASKAQVLMNSTVLFDAQGQPRSTLRAERRRLALAQLGERGMRAALSINERPSSILQNMIDAYIRGEAAALTAQSPEQLAATFQVAQWMFGLLPGVPEPSEVQSHVARESLLRTFRELASTAFAGRRSELNMLREYIGFLEPRSFPGAAVRGIQSFVGSLAPFTQIQTKAPLVIYGPGGIGKSALLARFVLDHLQPTDDDSEPLPFMCFDFDRASLVVERPMTLLIEAVDQLAIQLPQVASRWSVLKPKWIGMLQRPAISGDALSDFGQLLQEAGLVSRPGLLIFDTFEEVQYRSRDFVIEAFHIVSSMQHVYPRLRVVVVGRAPVSDSGIQVRNVLLTPLDAADAAEYLRLRGLEADFAKRVAEQVGGNPLSLRLALSVIEKEGVDKSGLSWLQTRNRLFMRLQDSQIQGQLYRRILGHIHDPIIAKLAHPGLVLRRLTPELILEVLAGPCELDVRDIEAARALFREMQREVSLVRIADDGSVRHLAEVRRVMLELLRRDEPMKVAAIQEAAIAYYRRQPESDLAARAELVYHQLLLSRPLDEVEAIWRAELGEYLGDAVEDLRTAPASAAWLASRLGLSIDPGSVQTAGLDVWERNTFVRVRDNLKLGKPEVAIALLREREERTYGSALHLPQAQAQIFVRDLSGAQNSVASGMREVHDPPTLLKLAITGSWADRLTLDPPARDADRQFERLRRGFGNDPRILRFGLNRLAHLKGTPEAEGFSRLLASRCSTVPDSSLSRYPLLGRDLAARLGGVDLELLLRLALLIGLSSPRKPAEKQFFQTLERWNLETGVFGRYHVDMSPADAVATLRNLDYLAKRERIPDEVTSALTNCFRTEFFERTDQMLYEEIELEPTADHGRPAVD